MPITSSLAVDKLVAQARSLPQLAASLAVVDPALAASLESKPLIASKTPWGTLLVTVIAWASSRYGLGWDETTCALAAGVALVAASYAMRIMSPSYIRGIFETPASPPSVPDVVPTNTVATDKPPV